MTFTYRPGKRARSVYLAGSFNDWNPTAHKMDGPDAQGRFSTRLKLKKGTYEYKFVLDDGQDWETDFGNIWQRGFNGNSEATRRHSLRFARQTAGRRPVRGAVHLSPWEEGPSVYLAGSFNYWKTMAHKMDGPDYQGRFSTRLKLKKGMYEYKSVLDGDTGKRIRITYGEPVSIKTVSCTSVANLDSYRKTGCESSPGCVFSG